MKKSLSVLVGALLASLSVAGIALADEHEEAPTATILTPQIIIDEETGTIFIGLPLDGELPEDCGPVEEVDGEAPPGPQDDEGVVDPEATMTYGPGDCIEFVMNHPSGKTHHGAVVSTVAKNLHPSMLDGIKKGEIMRWVAKTGKVNDVEDGDDGDGGEDGDAKVKEAKPSKAERDAAKELRKAERKAARDLRKAERAAAKDLRKANRGK